MAASKEDKATASKTEGEGAARFVEIGTIETKPKTKLAEYTATGKGLGSLARVTSDGRIVISLDVKKDLPDIPAGHAPHVEEFAVDGEQWSQFPKMNILICIVGSRGDVQPYVALGKLLLKDGHRVRLATHETFRTFISEEHGLEFFDIGGNPQDLMSYMVKRLMPGIESLTNGDIGKKRKMLAEMMNGCWLACHSPDQKTGRTFVADAIISNPPAFAHIHCAEALGVPLLMSFTMPWCATTAFPHPLVNISSSNAKSGLNNVLSYALAELLTWQGVGDLINDFRKKTLSLHSLSLSTGPGILERAKVPWTYCMSPALVPKPDDWKNNIDVVGFYFLDLATSYKPPEDLARFLMDGEPPVYIGFGSVVVDDPKAMSETIFEATKQAGVRALVSAGWGGLGGMSIPSHIFILGNVPHDWLFSEDRVAAVVHHGGAGTTAIGLAKGRPTVIVPFFGDQLFWGQMIQQAGAGPEPIPHKKLAVDNLRDALKFCLSPTAKEAAKKMAQQIYDEDGTKKGVESFYKHLPLLNMRCDLSPQRVAVWWSTEFCLKLSAVAAQILADARKLDISTLDTHRAKEYNTRKKIKDPVLGGSTAIFWTVTNYYSGIAKIFYSPVKGIVKTTTAIPLGIVNIISSVYEGFYNIPTMYGSKIRKRGKVTDFSSGVNQGAKELFYGYYDGITGLVTEPLAGAKKEGFLGAIKGSARSYANASLRPAAGIMGAISNPIQGAFKGVQSRFSKKQESATRKTRLQDGVEDVKRATEEERDRVLREFDKLCKKQVLEERRERWMKKAEAAFEEEQDEDDVSISSGVASTPSGVQSPDSKQDTFSSGSSADDSGREYSEQATGSAAAGGLQDVHTPDECYESDLQRAMQMSTESVDEDEQAYLRDLELAKQLSLQEQPGYGS